MISPQQLRTGMYEQGRVLHALLLREIQVRYGQKKLGYFWAFVEPAATVLIMIAIKTVLGNWASAQIPMPLLLVTGIVPFIMFRTITTRITNMGRSNRDVLIIPEVKMFDVMWAYVLAEFATCCIVMIAMVLICAGFGWVAPVQNPLAVFGCLILFAALAVGLGSIFCVVVAFFAFMQQVLALLLRILYLVSGAFFSIDRMPPAAIPYLLWNPLLHVQETLRDVYFMGYHVTAYGVSVLYTFGCAIGMMFIGLTLMKKNARQVLES